jgi:TolA-binding protein
MGRGLLGLAPALLALAALSTGCRNGALGGVGGATLQQDVFEIKTMLRDLREMTAANKRATDQQLAGLEDKIEFNNRSRQASIEELRQRTGQHSQDLQDIQKMLDELSFQLNTLATKLDMQAATLSNRSRDLLQPAEPGKAAFEEGHRLYNLAQYPQAAASFRQSLEKGLNEENKIQAMFWLGESHYRDAKLDEAGQAYTDLINVNSSHLRAWTSLERLAMIQEQRGLFDIAYDLYSQIATRFPNYENIASVEQRLAALKPKLNTPPANVPTPPPPDPAERRP